VIALAVWILSAIWLAFGFGYWPGPGDVRSESALWTAIGLDIAVLVLGIVAVLLAHRRKYPWFLAIVFVAAPIAHFITPFFGQIRSLFGTLPFVAVSLAVSAQYLRLLFRRSPTMRVLRRRLLIAGAVYGILWAITALFGTRQVAHHLRDLSHIDASFAPIGCSEFPEAAPDHAWGCCTISYAPFVVIAQYAYYDQGYSSGGAAMFLWCGHSWLIMPWPWGHSWIT